MEKNVSGTSEYRKKCLIRHMCVFTLTWLNGTAKCLHIWSS